MSDERLFLINFSADRISNNFTSGHPFISFQGFYALLGVFSQ
jgi:hypothetical protein